MALWEKSMRLQAPLLEQLKSFYGPRFPIEVRHYLAQWIEQQAWNEVDTNNPLHEQQARRLLENALHAIQDLFTIHSTNFIIRTQLEALYSLLNKEYSNQPMELVGVVQQCLSKELELIDQQEQLDVHAQSPMEHQASTNGTLIQHYLSRGLVKIEGMESLFRELSAKLDSYLVEQPEVFADIVSEGSGLMIPPRIQPSLQSDFSRMHTFGHTSRQRADEIENMCSGLSQQFVESLEEIRLCRELLVNQELARLSNAQKQYDVEWHRLELNTMQQWFESLAEILLRNRQLANRYEMFKRRLPQEISHLNPSSGLLEILTAQTVDLVKSSFVVEKQPPQVIKTSKRFSAVVRLLVGSKLNIPFWQPEVTVTIIDDRQAKTLAENPDKIIPLNFGSGEIINNSKIMECDLSGIFSASFNLMQLCKVKRKRDEHSEMVSMQKYCLLFRTRFALGNGEIEIDLRATSVPVTVIVHLSQQPPAEGTIFWDNAFAETLREPFSVPDSVKWHQVSEALSCYFSIQTGRGLTPPSLEYLGCLLLGVTSDEDLSQKVVTRSLMFKDQMHGRNFSFWEWFYKHMDLIRTTLSREWVEGLIQGFVSKNDAEVMLVSSKPGTFLIRFSESEPGSISVAWVPTDSEEYMSSEQQILNLAPWNRHDLGLRALADRLRDLYYLICLYPDKPKDKVFGKYFSKPSVGPSGYITSDLRLLAENITQEAKESHPQKDDATLSSFADITRLTAENKQLRLEYELLHFDINSLKRHAKLIPRKKKPEHGLYTDVTMAEGDDSIKQEDDSELCTHLNVSSPINTGALFSLPGVEVVGQTSVTVTNSEQSFHWTGYGFKLYIPQGSLPAGVDQCLLHISASTAGQYQFPDNMELVSAVYWVRCEPFCRFQQSLTAELQHCAKMTDSTKLTFVRAVCSQKDLPYTFKKLEGHGSFADHSSYGSLQLDRFSGIAVTGEDADLLYIASLYYRYKNPRNMEIHFVITRDDEPHITEVKQYFQKKEARDGPFIEVEFEKDKISLDIPMPEGVTVDEWKITPLVPPNLPQKRVDSFKPGRTIPSRQLKATLPHDHTDPIPERSLLVTLKGAKGPDNQMVIEIDPFNPIDRPSSMESPPPNALAMLNSRDSITRTQSALVPSGTSWQKSTHFSDMTSSSLAYLTSGEPSQKHAGYYYPNVMNLRSTTYSTSPYFMLEPAPALAESCNSLTGPGHSAMLSSDPRTSLTAENLECELKTIMLWKKLGTKLGIPQDKLFEIELNHSKVFSQKLALINLIVRNYQYRWEDICKALEKMEESNLASQIRSKYCTKDATLGEIVLQDHLISGDEQQNKSENSAAAENKKQVHSEDKVVEDGT